MFAELGGIITPMLSIFMVIGLSNYLSNNDFLKKIGRNTLYLCGNEYLIKILVPMVLSTFGLTVALTSPVQIYIYTFILLVVVNKVLVPLEKPCLDKIQKFLNFKKKPENKALESENMNI